MKSINPSLSGRNYEKKRLKDYFNSGQSELIAVIGRRRVGKTFLVKRFFQKEMLFNMTGVRDASTEIQLNNFSDELHYKLPNNKTTPSSWMEAFSLLKTFIDKKKTAKKRVLFFDELPWLASPRSGFLQAFDHFWNSWAVDQNIVIVICGSAATWMIKNIINDKGGLHNRVTGTINLEPFTLLETEQYFKDRKIFLPRYELIKLYMTFGGIPFYLRNIEIGESVGQSIDRLCFGRQAVLKNEFDNLYKALFNNYQSHLKIIKFLASKRIGYTRKQILKHTKFKSGGGFTDILRELEESSFITSIKPFGKKERDSLYRLTDEYSLFYLTFIDGQKSPRGSWIKKARSASVLSWQGYTFESVCYKHIDSIKMALGISSVYTEESSYRFPKTKDIPGFQIDMLIDRADYTINICEVKFYNAELLLTPALAKKIRLRKSLFQTMSKTKKQVITTLITTFGLATKNMQAGVDKVLDMNALFNPTN